MAYINRKFDCSDAPDERTDSIVLVMLIAIILFMAAMISLTAWLVCYLIDKI